MAVRRVKFFRKVHRWLDGCEDAMDYVVREATRKLLSYIQRPIAKGGVMPVDTGFLRNSLISSVQGGITIPGADVYVIATEQLKVGSVADFTWTARYARYVEYGTSKMGPRRFVGKGIDNWPRFVEEAVVQARGIYRL